MSVVDLDIGAPPRVAAAARGRWSSRLAFVLAAAGSAVGLGSIWKFPYITGVNGGGWFVLVYLACIALVATPIMIAEILIGRAAQRSPVAAFAALARGARGWRIAGWIGVAAAFAILSYYFVVCGWTLSYAWLALSGGLNAPDAVQFERIFAGVHSDVSGNLLTQGVFVAATAAIVAAGVKNGIERCCRALLPLLFIMMVALLVQALRSGSFADGVEFVFFFRSSEVTASGVLEALGHSFFTLSLGMGAMITYGSYLDRSEDVVAAAGAVAGLDTLVSLLACIVIFPIIFAFGLEPGAGPGLVFVSLPAAFAQMPGGALWAGMFFAVLAVAALSSTVSVFEVIVSHLIDQRGITRPRAAAIAALALFAAGAPAALSGGTRLFGDNFQALTAGVFGGEGRNWFDFVDYVASNWLLPLSGLAIAAFLAWRVGGDAREQAFKSGTRFGRLYWTWVALLRYFVPPAVGAVFLHAVGVV
jgi:neurotransmitter:Na+ symporter, NSS family